MMRQPTSTPWSMPSKVYRMYAEISAGTRNPRPPGGLIDKFFSNRDSHIDDTKWYQKKAPQTSYYQQRYQQRYQQSLPDGGAEEKGPQTTPSAGGYASPTQTSLAAGGEELHGDRETQTGKTTLNVSSARKRAMPHTAALTRYPRYIAFR